METKIRKEGNTTLIAIFGRLDTVSSMEFQKEIDSIADADAVNVEIDCTSLEYISSSGLRAFISILKRTQKNGGGTKVVNLNSNVKEVFDITGFSKLFRI